MNKQNQSRIINKISPKNHLPPSPRSFPALSQQHKETGNGGYSQFIICGFSPCSGRRLFLCCAMGSLPQETVLHKLLQSESIPWATAVCKLLQCGSPFHGVSHPRIFINHYRQSFGLIIWCTTYPFLILCSFEL